MKKRYDEETTNNNRSKSKTSEKNQCEMRLFHDISGSKDHKNVRFSLLVWMDCSLLANQLFECKRRVTTIATVTTTIRTITGILN